MRHLQSIMITALAAVIVSCETEENKMNELKRNMHTVQTAVEYFAVLNEESGGFGYPRSFEDKVYDKSKRKSVKAIELLPEEFNKDILEVSLSDPPNWLLVKPGQVVYVPILENGIVISYKIYGTDKKGQPLNWYISP